MRNITSYGIAYARDGMSANITLTADASRCIEDELDRAVDIILDRASYTITEIISCGIDMRSTLTELIGHAVNALMENPDKVKKKYSIDFNNSVFNESLSMTQTLDGLESYWLRYYYKAYNVYESNMRLCIERAINSTALYTFRCIQYVLYNGLLSSDDSLTEFTEFIPNAIRYSLNRYIGDVDIPIVLIEIIELVIYRRLITRIINNNIRLGDI